MVLVQGDPSNRLTGQAMLFLRYMEERRFSEIWDSMMTFQAKDLLSHSVMPIHFLDTGSVDGLLDIDTVKGLAFSFQMDHDMQRTAFFEGFSTAFIEHSWYRLDISDFMAFATDDAALVINGSQEKPLIVPFILQHPVGYVIDWEGFLAFSMLLSPRKLFEIGTRALVYSQTATASLFFQYSAKLEEPLKRLERLVLDQVLVQRYIADFRKDELRAELAYSKRAQEEVASIRSGPGRSQSSIDMTRFLGKHFKNYESSAEVTLTGAELERLDRMSDSKLRKAVAEILIGVDKHQVRREARKSHGPAELADIVVDVTFDGDIYSLCLPFKTGREMRSRTSVPENVVYQIWRPHMFLGRSIVVFITARPCSQFLLQDIRQSKDRMGWPISVIEHETLARLLKANDRL